MYRLELNQYWKGYDYKKQMRTKIIFKIFIRKNFSDFLLFKDIFRHFPNFQILSSFSGFPDHLQYCMCKMIE